MARAHASLAPTLIALGVAAELSSPATAHAQDKIHSFSPGLNFSISLGDKTAFGIGLDARYTMLLAGSLSECDSRQRAGLGFFGQATWLNFGPAGRFAAGVHGGGDVYAPWMALDGEFGWTYRTALGDFNPGGHAMHVGLNNIFFSFVDFSIRGTIPWPGGPKPELTIAMGAHFPPPYGMPTTCVIGRPLRGKDGYTLPLAATARRRATRAMRLDGATRAALASAWLEDARGECASIPAFVELARDLVAVGAPRDLVQLALSAARDEVRHTALALELSGKYGDMDIALERLLPSSRGGRDRLGELIRLAVESWQDACLGEGAAAERARRQFALAEDARAKKALAIIAADEARHAELGWRILAWCLSEGGRPVREALAEAIANTPWGTGAEGEGEVDRIQWATHGRISRGDVEGAWDKSLREAKKNAESLLAAA